MFAIPCPFCGSHNDDPFEVMANGTVDWSCCAHCKAKFFYLCVDCDRCGKENIVAWPATPAATDVSALICDSCGCSVRQDQVVEIEEEHRVF